MKSLITSSLFLTSFALGVAAWGRHHSKRTGDNCPTNGDPGQVAVVNAITAWNIDVAVVNQFLEHSSSLNGNQIAHAIDNVLQKATNEPIQLGVLACEKSVQPGTDAQAAVDNLMAGFDQNVIQPLQDIKANANNRNRVRRDVQTINRFRCCDVLPDLDSLWGATSQSQQVVNFVPVQAPRPSTCFVPQVVQCGGFSSASSAPTSTASKSIVTSTKTATATETATTTATSTITSSLTGPSQRFRSDDGFGGRPPKSAN